MSKLYIHWSPSHPACSDDQIAAYEHVIIGIANMHQLNGTPAVFFTGQGVMVDLIRSMIATKKITFDEAVIVVDGVEHEIITSGDSAGRVPVWPQKIGATYQKILATLLGW